MRLRPNMQQPALSSVGRRWSNADTETQNATCEARWINVSPALGRLREVRIVAVGLFLAIQNVDMTRIWSGLSRVLNQVVLVIALVVLLPFPFPRHTDARTTLVSFFSFFSGVRGRTSALFWHESSGGALRFGSARRTRKFLLLWSQVPQLMVLSRH